MAACNKDFNAINSSGHVYELFMDLGSLERFKRIIENIFLSKEEGGFVRIRQRTRTK